MSPPRDVAIPKFQHQDCSLTLGQGLEEFYTANEEKFSKPETGKKWSRMMAAHDACHVLFGVNTSIVEEAYGDVWTLLATTMKFKDYAEFGKSEEVMAIFKDVGVWNTVLGSITAIPGIFRIWLRSRKMTKKWDVFRFEEHLSDKLCDLRDEFNFRVLSAP